MFRRLPLLVFLILCVCPATAADKPISSAIPSYTETWAYDCDGSTDEVCTADGRVFFATDSAFGALDLSSGKQLWKKTIEGKGFGANLDCSGGTLYASVGEWRLLACDPRTGKERWSIQRKGFSTPIRVFRRTLFCELQSGTLAALDLKTRKTKWTLKIDDPGVADKQNRDAGLAARPMLIGNRLYIGSKAGEVLCLNPSSGKIIWRYRVPVPVGESGVSVSGLAADSRRIYATHDVCGIVAIDIATGKKSWSFRTRDQVYTAPAVFCGLVTFACWDGYLYALRVSDGSQAWRSILSKFGIHRSSAPVVRSNQLLVSVDDVLFAFDSAGKQLRANPIPDLGGNDIQVVKNGLLMLGSPWVGVVADRKPDAVPTDSSARASLANKLVARLDKLSRTEKRTLEALGDEGFAAVLPVVRERVVAYGKSAGAELPGDGSYELYKRVQAAEAVLLALATPKHTSEILTLLQDAKSAESLRDTVEWLVRQGDEQKLVPFCLSFLEDHSPRTESMSELDRRLGLALGVLSRSSDPRAVASLIAELRDPDADPALRQIAFQNLARTGGEAGAAAVIAAKDTTRTIPSLESFIRLDQLPLKAAGPDAKTSDSPCLAHLLEVKPNKNGAVWGLIECAASGSGSDLWIARQEDGKWTHLLFAGTAADMKGNDWLALTTGNSLAADSDGDGWTDALETRLGTDPRAADTDGDGLKDSEDKNPLAAPRQLGDTEQVLAAVFEARFRFADEGCLPFRVYVPNSVQPLELMGREWVTRCVNASRKPRLTGQKEKPEPNVSFRPPEYGFDLAKVYETDSNNVILWNSDKTEAKTHIVVYHGPLSATGFDVRLKKINGVWLVIEMQMIWIS